MPAPTPVELFRSREGTTGQRPRFVFKYFVWDADDEADARRAVGQVLIDGLSSESYDPYNSGYVWYPRTDIRLEPIAQQSNGKWQYFGYSYYGGVTKPARVATGGGGSDADEQQPEFHFDTGGGMQRIIFGERQITTGWTPGGVGQPINANGLIGVTEDSVDGVSIIVPEFNFSETHYKKDDDVWGTGYIALVTELAGKVHGRRYPVGHPTPSPDPGLFKGYKEGEILFKGASGSQRRLGEDWEINYRFSVKKTPDDEGVEGRKVIEPGNQTQGAIVMEGLHGFDYIWIRHKLVWDNESTPKSVSRRMISAHANQIYPYRDLNALDIPDWT